MFWVSLPGIHVSLVICVRGYTYHGNTYHCERWTRKPGTSWKPGTKLGGQADYVREDRRENVFEFGPGSVLAVRIDSSLRQCMKIYEICSKFDLFEKYK